MLPRTLALLLALPALAGCLSASEPLVPAGLAGPGLDEALQVVDAALYGRFHTTEEVEAKVQAWAEEHPGLVRVRSIGKSLEGRDVWAAFVTDRSVRSQKAVALLDGGHHANEVEGIETVLYTGDFLLANLGNATVRRILAETEVWLVPLVNPDGHAAQPRTRGNALGVNLNRNYDVDWGNPLGANHAVMGTAAHATGQPMPSISVVAENSGSAPFSEPESRAVRGLLAEAGWRLAFYLTMHTPAHSVTMPWSAFDPPFAIPPEHEALFQFEKAWIEEHTEYLAGRGGWGNFEAGLPYNASGTSQDWAYMQWHVPSFTFEQAAWPLQLASERDPRYLEYEDPGLEYWMRAGLPFVVHLLANAHRLKAWELPSIEVELPEGVPPEPAYSWLDGWGRMGPD